MDTMNKKIREILAELIEDDSAKQIADDEDFISLFELSSLQLVQFLVMVEEAFSIEFDIDELGEDSFKSIQKLEQSIVNHLNE